MDHIQLASSILLYEEFEYAQIAKNDIYPIYKENTDKVIKRQSAQRWALEELAEELLNRQNEPVSKIIEEHLFELDWLSRSRCYDDETREQFLYGYLAINDLCNEFFGNEEVTDEQTEQFG